MVIPRDPKRRGPLSGGPARTPRHEDAITQQAWWGSAGLVVMVATLGCFAVCMEMLTGRIPWAVEYGLLVQVPVIGAAVGATVWSVVWAIHGYRHRELRWILYGGGIAAVLFFLARLITA